MKFSLEEEAAEVLASVSTLEASLPDAVEVEEPPEPTFMERLDMYKEYGWLLLSFICICFWYFKRPSAPKRKRE